MTEREQILAALKSCNGNRSKAARLLGMPRTTLYRALKRAAISEPDRAPRARVIHSRGPVRLVLVRRNLVCARLELHRDGRALEILGELRGGRWNFERSPGHEASLERVVPLVEARSPRFTEGALALASMFELSIQCAGGPPP